MDHDPKFQRLVQFRAPGSLSDAIDAAAGKHLQSKSEYIRRSVVERLQADGFDPALTSVNASQAISVSTTNSIVAHSLDYGAANASVSGAFAYNSGYAAASQPSTGSNSISVTYTNGSQVTVKPVPPTLVGNFILRVI
jgi:hypothetical protein